MKRNLCKLLLAIILIISFDTHAKNVACKGEIVDIQIDRNSRLYASFSGVSSTPLRVNNSGICHLNGQSSDIEFCKSLYSSFLVAMTAKKTVTLWFNKSNGVCPSGNWVNLQDLGLYHFRIQR